MVQAVVENLATEATGYSNPYVTGNPTINKGEYFHH